MKKPTAYVFLAVLSVLMIYPLVWLFFASFKENSEIFGSLSLFPKTLSFEPFIKGWQGAGRVNYSHFFLNTLYLVVPTVLFTIISSVLVAYGFSRFEFIFKKFLFTLMISTLMLPKAVLIIPKFILFRNLEWLNTYWPFIVPAIFAANPFFIFMMVQFFRGIPRELDESAHLDGCNSFAILYRILIPLCKPAIVSIGIFQFIWTWNDFFNTLIYINSVSKFTVSLGLKMSIDTVAEVSWNQVMAMSMVAIVPSIVIFFLAQKYFVEGIATSGLKG
ncbi:carbohydrate ABC transporter permease [Paenibacillus cremeus]|uniref:Carbohydrate ABC transporter permease n=1 Tax=Paenibacillus cremeus TaxID=2163881 RepID=A0A559K794_9BACL|nr:carbohydrate ABC transporter permease [Paenibacillus cremeus]TVY07996.1 carbohydrate ABC transporter permease [Paenibacillus cremeus]